MGDERWKDEARALERARDRLAAALAAEAHLRRSSASADPAAAARARRRSVAAERWMSLLERPRRGAC